jgi:branched-chain amino acid transport system permease protein
MGSILGNFLGAAFMVLFPILLSNVSGSLLAGLIDAANQQNIEKIIFGALIVFFLIKEPDGLARWWQLLKAKARIWPLAY